MRHRGKPELDNLSAFLPKQTMNDAEIGKNEKSTDFTSWWWRRQGGSPLLAVALWMSAALCQCFPVTNGAAAAELKHLQEPTDPGTTNMPTRTETRLPSFLIPERAELKCHSCESQLYASQCTDVLNKCHSLFFFLCFQGNAAVHCVFWDFLKNGKCDYRAAVLTLSPEPLAPVWNLESISLHLAPSVLLPSPGTDISVTGLIPRDTCLAMCNGASTWIRRISQRKIAETQQNIRWLLKVTPGKAVETLLWSGFECGSESKWTQKDNQVILILIQPTWERLPL